MADVYVKELCETKHETIEKDIKVINKRLDCHAGDIAEIKESNSKSNGELREAIIELKTIVKLLTDKQDKGWAFKLAVFGSVVSPIVILLFSYFIVKK